MIFTYFMSMRYSCHDISTIVNLACENTEGEVGENLRIFFPYMCVFFTYFIIWLTFYATYLYEKLAFEFP